MKHVRTISRKPQFASDDIDVGTIITVVAQILTVIGSALTSKNGG